MPFEKQYISGDFFPDDNRNKKNNGFGKLTKSYCSNCGKQFKSVVFCCDRCIKGKIIELLK